MLEIGHDMIEFRLRGKVAGCKNIIIAAPLGYHAMLRSTLVEADDGRFGQIAGRVLRSRNAVSDNVSEHGAPRHPAEARRRRCPRSGRFPPDSCRI